VDQLNVKHRTVLEKRASFDMTCPRAELQFVELDHEPNGEITSFGVRGCGKQATYLLNRSGQWVQNSELERAP